MMIVRSMALEEHHNMTTLPTIGPQALPLDAPETYPFPKSREGLLPWSQVEVFLESAPNYWLATVRPNGRPHIAPLWGAWLDGAFYFQGAPDSRWARNLRTNSNVSVHLESVQNVVIVDGVATHVVTDSLLAVRLLEAWEGKYGHLEHPPRADTAGIYRLQPRTVRAWGEALNDGARWIFDEV
jgi:hypothetical protein